MTPTTTYADYGPLGVMLELFSTRDDEVVISGPAGTGKSRACLEKLHACCEKYEKIRALMVRKTRASLTSTGQVTFEQKVLPNLDWAPLYGSEEYRYPNGSTIRVGGMDKSSKVMSSEYDLIYVQEATELTEDDWEKLTTRLRNGRMPYQQLLADCNPDAPTHWLKRRADAGKTLMLYSSHEENPTLWDAVRKCWTDKGSSYIAKLDALSGVRFKRLRQGKWVAAEGIIYEGWDPAVHLIDHFEPPADWPRYWVVDFGYTNPFVWQAWAEDPDGRLLRYREIYHTRRLVEDHCRTIKQVTKNEPRPREILCDHDAEDRATFERHLEMSTIGAFKAVGVGIQMVQARLRPVGQPARPRLYMMRDSLVERDAELADAYKPTCTEEEINSYIWDVSNNRNKGEEPVKKDDHGMDATRYLVANFDRGAVLGLVKYLQNIQGELNETGQSVDAYLANQKKAMKEQAADIMAKVMRSTLTKPDMPDKMSPVVDTSKCPACGGPMNKIPGAGFRCQQCGTQVNPKGNTARELHEAAGGLRKLV